MDQRAVRWSGAAGIAFIVLYITATYLNLDAAGASDPRPSTLSSTQMTPT